MTSHGGLELLRVVLVGECLLLRSGFQHMLETAGIEVVASVPSAAEATNLEGMPPLNAMLIGGVTTRVAAEDVSRILCHYQGVGILVLGWSRAAATVRTYLDAGARGYLVIDKAADATLIEAVRTVAQGHMCVGSESSRVSTGANGRSLREMARTPLSERERQVLALLASGCSNRQIAATLGLSTNTVAAHRGNIRKTLGLTSTAQLVLFALRHGLVGIEHTAE